MVIIAQYRYLSINAEIIFLKLNIFNIYNEKKRDVFMLNYIWCGMIIISFAVSLFTGQVENTAKAAMDGAGAAVETCIGLLGVMCLWTGIAKIAEKSGLTGVFAKMLRPVTKILFPRLRANSAALNAIVMNMVANLLGMGNAATPLGLRAMKELDRLNGGSGTASDEMCMFVVVNTASIQLIPATVIALRQAYGSQSPAEIVMPVWICSICTVTAGVVAAKLFQRGTRRRERL